MRIGAISTVIALALIGAASAQTYATSEQPYGTAVPAYEAYEPTTFDAGAYEAATQPAPPLEVQAVDGGVVYEPLPYNAGTYQAAQPVQPAPVLGVQPIIGGAVYPSSPNDPALGDNLSLTLGAPETFSNPQNEAGGELGFAEETETSRLLLALEETYATRVSAMKAKHLTQRRAMLNAFEQEASDPSKVIGLAERMRAGLAELESAQKASLAEEERQYMAAMLAVLDRAPSRVE